MGGGGRAGGPGRCRPINGRRFPPPPGAYSPALRLHCRVARTPRLPRRLRSGAGGGAYATLAALVRRRCRRQRGDLVAYGGQPGAGTTAPAPLPEEARPSGLGPSKPTTWAVPGQGPVNCADYSPYVLGPDRRRAVICTGTCALSWPPLSVAAGTKPTSGLSVTLRGRNQAPVSRPFDHQSDHLRDGQWWSTRDDSGEGQNSDVRQCISADVYGPTLRDWKSCVGKLTVGSNPTLSASLGGSGQVLRSQATATGYARSCAAGRP